MDVRNFIFCLFLRLSDYVPIHRFEPLGTGAAVMDYRRNRPPLCISCSLSMTFVPAAVLHTHFCVGHIASAVTSQMLHAPQDLGRIHHPLRFSATLSPSDSGGWASQILRVGGPRQTSGRKLSPRRRMSGPVPQHASRLEYVSRRFTSTPFG